MEFEHRFHSLLTLVQNLKSRVTPMPDANTQGKMALQTIHDMEQLLQASLNTPLEDREGIARLSGSFFTFLPRWSQARMSANVGGGQSELAQEVHGLWSKLREAFFLKFNSNPATTLAPPTTSQVNLTQVPQQMPQMQQMPLQHHPPIDYLSRTSPHVPIRGQPLAPAQPNARRKSDGVPSAVPVPHYDVHPGPPPDHDKSLSFSASSPSANSAQTVPVIHHVPGAPPLMAPSHGAFPFPHPLAHPPPGLIPLSGPPPPGTPFFAPNGAAMTMPQMQPQPAFAPERLMMMHAQLTASAQLRQAATSGGSFQGELPVEVPLSAKKEKRASLPYPQSPSKVVVTKHWRLSSSCYPKSPDADVAILGENLVRVKTEPVESHASYPGLRAAVSIPPPPPAMLDPGMVRTGNAIIEGTVTNLREAVAQPRLSDVNRFETSIGRDQQQQQQQQLAQPRTPARNLLGQPTSPSKMVTRASKPEDVRSTPQARDHRPARKQLRENLSLTQSSGLPSLCLHDSRSSSVAELDASTKSNTSSRPGFGLTMPPNRPPARDATGAGNALMDSFPRGSSPPRRMGRTNNALAAATKRRSTSEPHQQSQNDRDSGKNVNVNVERFHSNPLGVPSTTAPLRLPERSAPNSIANSPSDGRKTPAEMEQQRDSLFDDDVMGKCVEGLRGCPAAKPTDRIVGAGGFNPPREHDMVTEDFGVGAVGPDGVLQSFEGISTVFTVSPGPEMKGPDGRRLPSVAADSCIEGFLATGLSRVSGQRLNFDEQPQTKRVSQASYDSLGGEEDPTSPSPEPAATRKSSRSTSLRSGQKSASTNRQEKKSLSGKKSLDSRDMPPPPRRSSTNNRGNRFIHDAPPKASLESLEYSMSNISVSLGQEGQGQLEKMEELWKQYDREHSQSNPTSRGAPTPPSRAAQPEASSSSRPATRESQGKKSRSKKSIAGGRKSEKRHSGLPKPKEEKPKEEPKKATPAPKKQFGVSSAPRRKIRDVNNFWAKQEARRKQLEQYELTNEAKENVGN